MNSTDRDAKETGTTANPLWVITIGMAVFFGVMAALMAVG